MTPDELLPQVDDEFRKLAAKKGRSAGVVQPNPASQQSVLVRKNLAKARDTFSSDGAWRVDPDPEEPRMAVNAARAKSLFLAAADLTNPTERAAFLDRECGHSELRARVEALLRADAAAPFPPNSPEGANSAQQSSLPMQDVQTSDPTAQSGAVIAGKYTLVELIGEGGMGDVWRAKQTEPVKRFVAVKLIKAGMDSKSVLARFDA